MNLLKFIAEGRKVGLLTFKCEACGELTYSALKMKKAHCGRLACMVRIGYMTDDVGPNDYASYEVEKYLREWNAKPSDEG